MGEKCDKKEGYLNCAHVYPRVVGYKRGSDIMEVSGVVNTIGRTYASNQEINKHIATFMRTITKCEEVRFSIRFLEMLHRRIANATEVLFV